MFVCFLEFEVFKIACKKYIIYIAFRQTVKKTVFFLINQAFMAHRIQYRIM